MKKKEISLFICIMTAFLTGCTKEKSQAVYDVTLPVETSEEISTDSEEYRLLLQKLPINQDDYDIHIGTEIESSEILFDEEKNQYINRIKYKIDYSENIFYVMQSYITLDLELNEDRSEWELSEYNREHHSMADLLVTQEILEDNVSGEYDVYRVSEMKDRRQIMAKIDKWDYYTYRTYGNMKIELIGCRQGMEIDIEGEVMGCQIKDNLLVHSFGSPEEILNWTLEEGGFRYTPKDNIGISLEMIFKEDTEEIFILTKDGKGNYSLYTLVKKS